MKRQRINNLVFTTKDDEHRQRIAKMNRKVMVFQMTIFGKKERISRDDYLRLKNAGYNVEEVCL